MQVEGAACKGACSYQNQRSSTSNKEDVCLKSIMFVILFVVIFKIIFYLKIY